MKTYFALAVTLTGFADATICSPFQQQSAYLSMVSLLASSSLNTCSTSSGFNALYSTTLLTDAMSEVICGVEACRDLIDAVLATNPPNCDLTIPTSGAAWNVYQIASGFKTQCDAQIATDAPTTAPTDASTEAPTDAPTEAPTDAPTDTPTGDVPTSAPTAVPNSAPTDLPTDIPTTFPTDAPTDAPTTAPTNIPTIAPTDIPTATAAPTTPTETPATTVHTPGPACH